MRDKKLKYSVHFGMNPCNGHFHHFASPVLHKAVMYKSNEEYV